MHVEALEAGLAPCDPSAAAMRAACCVGLLTPQITEAVAAARIQLAPLLKGSGGAISKSAPTKKKVSARLASSGSFLPRVPANSLGALHQTPTPLHL